MHGNKILLALTSRGCCSRSSDLVSLEKLDWESIVLVRAYVIWSRRRIPLVDSMLYCSFLSVSLFEHFETAKVTSL